jgi:hypothetical protein
MNVYNTTDVAAEFTVTTANTNMINSGSRNIHRSTGTPVAGFGGAVAIRCDDDANNIELTARYSGVWSDATAGSVSSYGKVTVMDAGSETDSLRFYPTGVSFDDGSNILGDYESNISWTPVLRFGGGTTGITYSTQSATYTRVGSLVSIDIRIILTSKGTSTGNATITGLGLTPTPEEKHGVIKAGNITFSGNYLAALIRNNSGFEILVQQVTSGGVVGNITNTGFANNTEISINANFSVT